MVEIGTRVVYDGSLPEYAGEEFKVTDADAEYAATLPEFCTDGYAYTLRQTATNVKPYHRAVLIQVRRTSFTVL